MAGSFGFEAHKYNVSKMIAESRLLPAVRALPEGALLIADGFSCREQVDDLAGIRPLHLAEVIAQALPVDAGIHLSTRSLYRTEAPGGRNHRRNCRPWPGNCSGIC